jgi:hypothetical protein
MVEYDTKPEQLGSGLLLFDILSMNTPSRSPF